MDILLSALKPWKFFYRHCLARPCRIPTRTEELLSFEAFAEESSLTRRSLCVFIAAGMSDSENVFVDIVGSDEAGPAPAPLGKRVKVSGDSEQENRPNGGARKRSKATQKKSALKEPRKRGEWMRLWDAQRTRLPASLPVFFFSFFSSFFF